MNMSKVRYLLKSLGFIEAAKRRNAPDPFVWAVERFCAFQGIRKVEVNTEFMKHLKFVAKINQVGPYDPVNNMRCD